MSALGASASAAPADPSASDRTVGGSAIDPSVADPAVADPTLDASMDDAVAGGSVIGRLAFGGLAWLFVACLAVQLYLVGIDVVGRIPSTVHRDFAYLYGWLAPGLVLLGAAARVPVRLRWLAVALVVLFAFEVTLPAQRETSPILAALHPPLAIAIVLVALALALGARPAEGWRALAARARPTRDARH